MKILGIHDGHNASACLMVNSKIVSAVQEERLTKIKNFMGFPSLAVRESLALAGLDINDIDLVGINGIHMPMGWKTKRELLERYEKTKSFSDQVKWRLKQVKLIDKIYIDSIRKKRVEPLYSNGIPKEKIAFVDHHLAHAAAAYYGWGKYGEKILILTCDGAGDRVCATVNIGLNGEIKRLCAIPEEDSLGSLYAKVTYLMGMAPLEHEYKIMGLAPYSKRSSNSENVFNKFNSLFQFDQRNPCLWHRNKKVPATFYATKFLQELLYRERFDSVAAGLQKFFEVFLVNWVRNCIRKTGIRKIALGGGVFMNVKVNKLIMELPEVDDLFIFPSCGDETNAFGICYHLFAQEQMKGAQVIGMPALEHFYFGREYSNEEIAESIKKYKFDFPVAVRWENDIEKKTAELLAREEVVARFKGRSEFGARALGNRSILANPKQIKVVRIINEMVKNRDFWMPFCPSVMEELSQGYYQNPKKLSAPYMILSFDAKEEKIDSFIAATHPYDYTTRPQEVSQKHNPCYYSLLKHFKDLTQEAIILNTSFNLHGYPMVYSPDDAIEVFAKTGLRHLALGNYHISKK